MYELPQKIYYSIGEIAKSLDLNTSTIRYWEKEFEQLHPKKKDSGIRKYTHTDLQVIQKIHHLLKVNGYTIQGAKTALGKRKKITPIEQDKRQKAIQKLKNIRSQLQQIRDKLV